MSWGVVGTAGLVVATAGQWLDMAERRLVRPELDLERPNGDWCGLSSGRNWTGHGWPRPNGDWCGLSSGRHGQKMTGAGRKVVGTEREWPELAE